MLTFTARLLRLFVRRGRDRSPGWWAYLGSFGDDFFGDPELPDPCPRHS